MTSEHAMLCYNPGTDQVAIVEHPDYARRSDSYAMSVLACFYGWGKGTFKQRKAMIFIEAWQAVIRDRVDPMALHRALLALDEYRAGLAEDVPGMGKRPA